MARKKITRAEIANILKRSRINAGLTQQKAADAVGSKQTTLASWESAKSQPDANTLFILCDLYGVSADEAFGFKKKQESTSNSLNSNELMLVNSFRELNDEGQEDLLQHAEDMTYLPRYKKRYSLELGEEKAN